MTVTTPFCSHCGYDFVAKNRPSDEWCDSCGAELFRSVAAGEGPQATPAAPTVADAGSGIADVTWTADPGFDSYNVRWKVNGAIADYEYGATSPESTFVNVGDEVCASLQGVTDGIGSPWSADHCVTLA